MTARLHTPDTRRKMLTADVRKAVDEWTALGYAVEIRRDGSLRVEPTRPAPEGDAFDMVDMRR